MCVMDAVAIKTCSDSLNASAHDAEVEAEEKVAVNASWKKNAKLGRFTNFVNLLDLAAVAVPSGVLHCRPNVGATGACCREPATRCFQAGPVF